MNRLNRIYNHELTGCSRLFGLCVRVSSEHAHDWTLSLFSLSLWFKFEIVKFFRVWFTTSEMQHLAAHLAKPRPWFIFESLQQQTLVLRRWRFAAAWPKMLIHFDSSQQNVFYALMNVCVYIKREVFVDYATTGTCFVSPGVGMCTSKLEGGNHNNANNSFQQPA